MRSFLPDAEKWSPFDEADWRSRVMMRWKAALVDSRVWPYRLGEYMPFTMKTPGPVCMMWCHSFWRAWVVGLSAGSRLERV